MTETGTVHYRADGLTMVGHIALPDGTDRRPGVLIGQEGTGLNDFQRRRADHLAERGYVALAFDYHGGRWFTEPEEMMARVGPLLADPERMRAIGRAALDELCEQDRCERSQVAAIGYGAGGNIAMELARDGVSLRAVAAFNPSLAPVSADDSVNIGCPLLVGVGSEDPIVPQQQRDGFQDEMRAAGVDWRLHIYGGAEHAFHHPQDELDDQQRLRGGVGYHERHARRAWSDMLNLLEETLG